MNLYDTLRVIDLVLYALILLGMITNRADFLAANRQIRMMLVGLGGLVVAGAYSAVEILLAGLPGGPRLFIVTVPLVFLAIGMHIDFLAAAWLRVRPQRKE